jgi:hypothetical protein
MPDDDRVTSYCPRKIKNRDSRLSTIHWIGACKINIAPGKTCLAQNFNRIV